MSSTARTIVATGCSSGLGFDAIKQLLTGTRPHRLVLGARDVPRTETAFNDIKYDQSKHDLAILPLQLSDLNSVRSFARQTLESLGQTRVDCLLLNAATSMGSEKPGTGRSEWSEAFVVNHLAQHYLLHLLREKLVQSGSRVVFVSSGAIRQVSDTSSLLSDVRAGSGLKGMDLYPRTKFTQLVNAHWWRRQLQNQCRVVAVSPGLIPGTGLGRDSGFEIPGHLPDAKSVAEGGANVLRALDIEEFPEDGEQIFLTSWGEWWPKDVYQLSLDEKLQDEFSPSREKIEASEGIAG